MITTDKSMLFDEQIVPISALQHYVFCPRQCAYIHIERVWDANYLTAHGDQLHERVHSTDAETRRGLRTERGVQVCSESLGIVGKLDLLEVKQKPFALTPVEYKHGKSKISDCDRVQLCAQVLCLEEMREIMISKAALWYWQVRKREWVEMNDPLRAYTREVIEQTRALLAAGHLPHAEYTPGCKGCSFLDRCRPKLKDTSTRFSEALFACHEEAAE